MAFSDAFALGVLQSSAHVAFADRVGGWLGVGNDSTYNHSDCFEKFPFPDEDTGLTPALRQRIAHLADQIDTFRKKKLVIAHTDKAQAAINSAAIVPCAGTPQAPTEPGAAGVGGDVAKRSASESPAPAVSGELQHSASLTSSTEPPPMATKPAKDLTLTGLHNALQALREGRPLTLKEKEIHNTGLVGVLKTLHDELDAAVLQAYGWADLQAGLAASPTCPEFATARDELLIRLVALNAQRAAEKARGQVRWLRPAFQNPLLKQELLMHV